MLCLLQHVDISRGEGINKGKLSPRKDAKRRNRKEREKEGKVILRWRRLQSTRRPCGYAACALPAKELWCRREDSRSFVITLWSRAKDLIVSLWRISWPPMKKLTALCHLFMALSSREFLGDLIVCLTYCAISYFFLSTLWSKDAMSLTLRFNLYCCVDASIQPTKP